MTLLLATVVGCGSATQTPLKSTPTAPTVTFPAPEVREGEIVWTELEELFPRAPAALPDALASLVPGQKGAEARDLLEQVREPGAKILGNMTETALEWRTILGGAPDAQVLLTLDPTGAELVAIDVLVPQSVAVPMLTTRWGPPATTQPLDGGGARYGWVGAGPWAAELASTGGSGAAAVHFTPREPLPPRGGPVSP